jgi:hydroxymethylpyrimidine/phosphomethylpyrimidine kinase
LGLIEGAFSCRVKALKSCQFSVIHCIFTHYKRESPLQPTASLSSPQHYPRVLSIAGSDSGGGAGIQADLKTFSALGCYGMTAITALTAQNTQGVQGIFPVSAQFLKQQIQSVAEDIGVDAVKIGMLHTPQIVEVVCWAIEHFGWQRVVLDPVMVATSGDRLINEETVQVLVKELFPLVTLITPNLDEAEVLLGRKIVGIDDLDAAASELLALGAPSALLKGGHLPGATVVDVLATRIDRDGPGVRDNFQGVSAAHAHQDTQYQRLQSSRIPSHNVHGTGCTLSSAIAAHLARGESLSSSVTLARAYIVQAIEAGRGVQIGQPGGHGPLNHGFAPQAMYLV